MTNKKVIRKPSASRGFDKKMYIQFFAIPSIRSVAAFLRFKDVNSTGSDDEAARAIEISVEALEKWLASPES